MYSKLVGVVRIRTPRNRFLFDIFSELSVICEKVIVDDRFSLLSEGDQKLLLKIFDVDIYKTGYFDLSVYAPDWVITLYDDETPSRQFIYMKDALCSHEYINIWESEFLVLWDEEDQYRDDKLWGCQEFPVMYRWIPEVDYQYENGNLLPCNQQGPKEKCGAPILSYRFLTGEQRVKIYKEFVKEKETLNYVTNLHYESLLDTQISLKKLVR